MSATNLSEIDLNDPKNIKACLKAWDLMEEHAHKYPKLIDLRLELEDRWKAAGLSEDQKRAVTHHLIENRTQKETGELMNIGSRWVARIVERSVEKMAEAL